MDGRGRALDNVFVEHLWRSLKYEEVYLKDYESVLAAVAGLDAYFAFYNDERLRQSLGYRTPGAVHLGDQTDTRRRGETPPPGSRSRSVCEKAPTLRRGASNAPCRGC